LDKYYPNNYSITYDTIHARSNYIERLNHQYDLIKIDTLVIPTIINLDEIFSFEILIGSSTIFSIPFELLIRLSEIETIDDNYYITLNENILKLSNKHNDFVPLLYLQYNEVRINMIAENNFNYDVITHNKIYYEKFRETLVYKNSYEKFDTQISQFYSDEITNPRIKLRFLGVTTGFFIKLSDKLNNLKIEINGINYIEMDKFMIKKYGKLINTRIKITPKHSKMIYYMLNKLFPDEIIKIIEDKYKKNITNQFSYLYWIPIEPYKNWYDNYSSCSLNLSKNNNVVIILKTENNKYDGNIFTLIKHIVNFEYGMAYIKRIEDN